MKAIHTDLTGGQLGRSLQVTRVIGVFDPHRYLIVLIPYVGGIVLIVLLALRGNAGPNEYGSAPGVPAMPLGNVDPLPPPPPKQDSGFAR
jgi:hypothetical protein